jgi:hypothetical protein
MMMMRVIVMFVIRAVSMAGFGAETVRLLRR